MGAGLVGATYVDKEKKTMDNLPMDYLKIRSGLGESQPAKLILLPLKTDDGEILGVAELAFLTRIPDTVQEFLNEVAPIIALNIHAVNLNHKTMLLLPAIERTNRRTSRAGRRNATEYGRNGSHAGRVSKTRV